MADAPQDDELLLTADDQLDETKEQGSDKPGDEGEDELEVTFGDEAAPASGERDTGLVKHLREEIRRRDAELARRPQPQAQKVEIGPKPSIASCEYDEERYEAELDAWKDRTAKAAQAETEADRGAREANEAWNNEVRTFEAKRAELKTPKAQEAIDTAISALSNVQQAVIVKAADNAANVLCALGMHPAKLAEIAAIQDPLKQAVAIAKLEGTLKVTTRRKAPDPEEIASGNSTISHGSDSALERLEKQAAKTGDRTELIRYKKQVADRGKK